MFTFFCPKATEASLRPLYEILLALQGNTTQGIKTTTNNSNDYNGSGWLDNNSDSEDDSSYESLSATQVIKIKNNNNNKNNGLGFMKNVDPEDTDTFLSGKSKLSTEEAAVVGGEATCPIPKLDPGEWGGLDESLKELYNYLRKNKESYYDSYVLKIAEKAKIMVIEIDGYFKEKDMTGKSIKLGDAKVAIDDFYNAFQLHRTRNTILFCGLILAVMAVIDALLILFAGPLGIPVIIAGFIKIGAVGTIGKVINTGGSAVILLAILRNLFSEDRAKLKKFADDGQTAAKELLPGGQELWDLLSNMKDNILKRLKMKPKDFEGSRKGKLLSSEPTAPFVAPSPPSSPSAFPSLSPRGRY